MAYDRVINGTTASSFKQCNHGCFIYFQGLSINKSITTHTDLDINHILFSWTINEYTGSCLMSLTKPVSVH